MGLSSSHEKTMRYLNVFMLFYAIVSIIRAIADYIWYLPQLTSCEFTELLINYQGGYVRRGLFGECLFQLSSLTGVDPRYYITVFCALFFCAAVGIMLYLFKKHNLNWWVLMLTCCLSASEILRKDFLMVLLSIATLYMLCKHKSGWRQYIPAIIFCLMMQLHEACIFYLTGAVLVMYIFDKERKLTVFSRIAVSSAVLLVALFTMLSKGSNEIAQQVHDSWVPMMPAEFGVKPSGTIGSLGWELLPTVKFCIRMNFFCDTAGFLLLPFLYILTAYAVPRLLFIKRSYQEVTSIESDANRFLSIFFLQFCLVAPLGVFLMCDQARAFAFWVVSSILIYMFLPRDVVAYVLPDLYKRLVHSVQKVIFHKRFFLLPLLLLLFAGIPPYFTTYAKAFENSIVGRIIGTYKIVMEYLF